MKQLLTRMAAAAAALACLWTGNAVFQRQAAPADAPAGEEPVTLPIVMYHSILRDPGRAGDYVLSPDALESDLDWLAEAGYETVTVADLIAWVDEGTPLPEKPVMITFDDGQYNNYLYAAPLLEARGMRAVLSIIGAQTELFTRTGQENAYWSYLTSERLGEAGRSGVFEIQNHSYDLHDNGVRRGCLRRRGEDAAEYEAMLRADTARTQQIVEGAGLPAPTCYTYPFGARSNEAEQILRDMGFRCTMGCEEGLNTLTRDAESLYGLRRYNRPSGVSSARFFDHVLGEDGHE